MEKTLARL